MSLADDMLRYRAKNNVSQEKLAEMCGCSKMTINSIENGNTAITKLTETKIRLVIDEIRKEG